MLHFNKNEYWVISSATFSPIMPYHGPDTPGPLRHERREYLWTSVLPRRPRLEWEAVQHRYSEQAERNKAIVLMCNCGLLRGSSSPFIEDATNKYDSHSPLLEIYAAYWPQTCLRTIPSEQG